MPKKLDPKVAEKVMLKAGLKPLEPYKNRNTPWKCKCLNCGVVTTPRYSNVKFNKTGCKNCGKLSQAKKSRASEEDLVKLMLAKNLQPLQPYKSRRTPWKCRCLNCGKTVYPRVGGIKSGQGGCNYCAKNQVDENDAVTFMLNNLLQPLEPYTKSLNKWKCKCLKCGSVVFPSYHDIKSKRQGGCGECAQFGINTKSPSYLYLVTNDRLSAHKIGIGNHKNSADRLTSFIKQGWITFKVWEFSSGSQALKIEKTVFKIIRNELKIPIFLSKEQMPKTYGHVETMGADSISLIELEKIIKKVIKSSKIRS